VFLHTPPCGRISVRLAQQDSACIITVSDNGGGMPAEAQPHIFVRLYRADKARGRAEKALGGGAGLGLSIAKRIAEAHEGSLTLQHPGDQVSTFAAVLPIRNVHYSTTCLFSSVFLPYVRLYSRLHLPVIYLLFISHYVNSSSPCYDCSMNLYL
jgi:hypothetical protein